MLGPQKRSFGMKSKMYVPLAVLYFVFLLCTQVFATNVNGIIDQNTTWTLDGSPYFITGGGVQIAEGITLTIEPGVIVEGGGITVWGNLQIVGNELCKITLNDVYIYTGSDNASVRIEYCNIYKGCPFRHGGGEGSLILRNSRLEWDEDTCISPWLQVYLPKHDCYIEKNIFYNIPDSISITNYGDAYIYVKNNVFLVQKSIYCPETILRVDSGPETVIERNSFLNTDKVAISACGYYSGFTAINNYWNTTDTTVIDTMIIDRNDSLGCPGYLSYLPILAEPDPETPMLDINQAPIAEAGPDQIVFDEIILDGSSSSDPDDDSVSYEWQIHSRTYPGYEKIAEGEIVKVSKLQKGFYDVVLIVTDEHGMKATDKMMFTATGPKGDFDFDNDVDGDDLAIFATSYGR